MSGLSRWMVSADRLQAVGRSARTRHVAVCIVESAPGVFEATTTLPNGQRFGPYVRASVSAAYRLARKAAE